MKYYIYGLIDPDDGKVRYVGSSKQPKVRFKQHLNKLDKAATPKKIWLLRLKAKGKQPELRIFATASTKDEATDLEDKYFWKYARTALNIHFPGKGKSRRAIKNGRFIKKEVKNASTKKG